MMSLAFRAMHMDPWSTEERDISTNATFWIGPLTHCLRFGENEPFLRSSDLTEASRSNSLFNTLASLQILMQADLGMLTSIQ